MKPLETRKQLLLAESALNRTQMVQELDAMKASINALTTRVKSMGSIASGAALLATTFIAFRRGKPGESHRGGMPWLLMLRKGAGLISSLWPAFGFKKPHHRNNQPASHS